MRRRAARIDLPTALRAALALAVAALVLLVTLPAGADAAAARTTTVKMGDFFYAPKRVRVKVGDRVRFGLGDGRSAMRPSSLGSVRFSRRRTRLRSRAPRRGWQSPRRPRRA